MLRNGAERVVTSGKEHLFDLKSLEHYKFMDEVGKDQGINGIVHLLMVHNQSINHSTNQSNDQSMHVKKSYHWLLFFELFFSVRNRVKEIVDLLQDDARLRDERKKARKTKDKYVGLSADEAQMRVRRGIFSLLLSTTFAFFIDFSMEDRALILNFRWKLFVGGTRQSRIVVSHRFAGRVPQTTRRGQRRGRGRPIRATNSTTTTAGTIRKRITAVAPRIERKRWWSSWNRSGDVSRMNSRRRRPRRRRNGRVPIRQSRRINRTWWRIWVIPTSLGKRSPPVGMIGRTLRVRGPIRTTTNGRRTISSRDWPSWASRRVSSPRRLGLRPLHTALRRRKFLRTFRFIRRKGKGNQSINQAIHQCTVHSKISHQTVH